MQANPPAPTAVLQTDSFDAGVDAPVDDGDKDVVAGFPVKRFVLMLIYANMICIGGAFATVMAFGIYSMLTYTAMGHYAGYGSTPLEGFCQLYGSALEQMWSFVSGDLAQTARFLFLAIVPGTIAGIAWYLVLRWRESVILRKRLRAAKARATQAPL